MFMFTYSSIYIYKVVISVLSISLFLCPIINYNPLADLPQTNRLVDFQRESMDFHVK